MFMTNKCPYGLTNDKKSTNTISLSSRIVIKHVTIRHINPFRVYYRILKIIQIKITLLNSF